MNTLTKEQQQIMDKVQEIFYMCLDGLDPDFVARVLASSLMMHLDNIKNEDILVSIADYSHDRASFSH